MLRRPQSHSAAGKDKSIFPVTHRDSNSRTFDMECCASTNRTIVCPIEVTYMRPLDDNKEINVNPSLSSIRYQNKNSWYPIFIQICQCISIGATFKSDQTVCEVQSFVWKWFWSGTGGKMLQSVVVNNSCTLKDMYCDVCVVYWLRK